MKGVKMAPKKRPKKMNLESQLPNGLMIGVMTMAAALLIYGSSLFLSQFFPAWKFELNDIILSVLSGVLGGMVVCYYRK